MVRECQCLLTQCLCDDVFIHIRHTNLFLGKKKENSHLP